jgi:hypothetical protein
MRQGNELRREGDTMIWSDIAPPVTAVIVVALGYATQLKLEKGRRKSAASEDLKVLRRVECVRMLTAAERVVQLELPSVEVEVKAKADLADGDLTLQLLGPSHLAEAASALAVSARAAYGIKTPSYKWDEYRVLKGRFINVAKEVLGVSEGGEAPLNRGAAAPPLSPTLS